MEDVVDPHASPSPSSRSLGRPRLPLGPRSRQSSSSIPKSISESSAPISQPEIPPPIQDEPAAEFNDDEPSPRYSSIVDRPNPEPEPVVAEPVVQEPVQEEEVQEEEPEKREEPESIPARPAVFSPPVGAPSPAPSIASSSSKPPILTPIPPIELDTPPLPWKGMSLQSAQWTLTSEELQSVVSRAIRASARESFIRLQSLDVLDNVLEQESAKLEDERREGRARLRWIIGRRGMLLQALLSSTLAVQTDADSSLVANLTHQLHALATEGDMITQNLIQATSRLGQIQSLIDVHSASALSIALRKLNASYAKRTAELLQAREEISNLTAQVEDAWAEAEKVAKDADNDETSRYSFERHRWEEERVAWQADRERFEEERRQWEIERKELAQTQVVNVHHPRSVNVHHPGTLTVTRRDSVSSGESDLDDEYDEGTAIIRRAEVMMMPKTPPPTLGHMRSKSNLTFGLETQASFEFVPAASATEKGKITLDIPTAVEPSMHSSTPTTPRSRSQSRASQVAAAKRRSRQPSLRLPKSVVAATLRANPPPPVPNIPQNVKANGDDDNDEGDEDLEQMTRIARLGASETSKALSPVDEPPRPSSSVNSHTHTQPRTARPNSMDSHITGGIGVPAPQPAGPSGAKTMDDIVFNKSHGAAGIPSMWTQSEKRPTRNVSSYFLPSTSTSAPQHYQPQRTTSPNDTFDLDLSDLVIEPVRHSPPALVSRFSSTPVMEHPPEPRSPPASTSKMAGGVMKLKGLKKRYSLPFPMFTGSGIQLKSSNKSSGSKLKGEVIEEEGGTIGSSPLVRVQK